MMVMIILSTKIMMEKVSFCCYGDRWTGGRGKWWSPIFCLLQKKYVFFTTGPGLWFFILPCFCFRFIKMCQKIHGRKLCAINCEMYGSPDIIHNSSVPFTRLEVVNVQSDLSLSPLIPGQNVIARSFFDLHVHVQASCQIVMMQSSMSMFYNKVYKEYISLDGLFRNAPRCRKTGACRILVPLRRAPH